MTGDAAVVEAWAAAPPGDPAERLAPLLDAVAGVPGPRTLAADDVLACRLLDRFGRSDLDGAATCPACAERLDVTLVLPAAAPAGAAVVEAGGRSVRLPAQADVDAAVAAGTARMAGGAGDALAATAHALLEQLTGGGGPLDPTAVAELDAALVDAAPASPPPVDLACPACGHTWTALVDLAAFAWDRVDRHARRLLGEVHRLASAYGWTHREVLALPGPVRRRYLELVP